MKQEVINFGCRLNSYESDLLKSNLSRAALPDSVAVFNTCAVTSEAERQARQAIRKYKREHPESRIIVTGCAAQVNPQKFADMLEVSQVIGNSEKLFTEYLQPSENKIMVRDIMEEQEAILSSVISFEGKVRSYLQIQNGCNHRCTFCIIPFGRGNNRSIPISDLITQAKQIVAAGYKEIVLTGVDITDYGTNLEDQPKLGTLVDRLLREIPDLPRLRLSSVDVAEIDPLLFHLLSTHPRLMPHVHISVQSGDNLILKRMKRRHHREQVIEFCHSLRKLRPEIAFGADIITGFPTESDEHFQNSLALVNEAGLQYLHVFPYSERDGTPASRMPQMPKDIRKARASVLRAEGELELTKFKRSLDGKKQKAIVEFGGKARLENYLLLPVNEDLREGEIVEVELRYQSEELYGEVL